MRLKAILIIVALVALAAFVGYAAAQSTADDTWGDCAITGSTLTCSFFEHVTTQQPLAYIAPITCLPPVFEATESRYRHTCALRAERLSIPHTAIGQGQRR
jgi:hypothetical protein